jgi:L-iditol 2-dehydrogenase
VNPHRQINKKHVELRGCWGCDFSHVYRALQILAGQGHSLPWAKTISARYPLEKAGDALAAVERREVIKAVLAPLLTSSATHPR